MKKVKRKGMLDVLALEQAAILDLATHVGRFSS
jgi:hypothetical protein